jgi:hypothetical protein
MIQYKIQLGTDGNPCSITIVGQLISIPLDPANTDYANFKKEILADEAQLQDADGNTMTAEQAKTYVATLP